jgi:small subunit ribosomal protein S8
MTTNDHLSASLSKINNAEKVSKNIVVIDVYSKMIQHVLDLLSKHSYLGKILYEQNKKGGKVTVELVGSINKTGAIKPRYKVKATEIEKFEQRYLPAKSFGLLIISTSKGLMTNVEAKEKKIGGRLIAYCY